MSNNSSSTKSDRLSNIYQKYYNASRTDKDIENELARENIGLSSLGGSVASVIGSIAGSMYGKPAIGTLAGLTAGSAYGYGMGKLTEKSRRNNKYKIRDDARALLNKRASDNSDRIHKAVTDSLMLANTAAINHNTAQANTLSKAKDLAAFKGIKNLDPRDSDTLLELEGYYDNTDDTLVAGHEKGMGRLRRLYGTIGGASVGTYIPSVVREIKGTALPTDNIFKPRNIVGGIIGGIAGNQLSKLIKRKEYEYNNEEAQNRVARDRKAYKDALREKYGK